MKIVAYIFMTVVLLSCASEEARKPEPSMSNSDSLKFESGFTDVNGISMYFEIHGDGKPLVLIHGGGSTISSSFGRIIPMLSQTHKVIAMDLQNHGRSGHRDTPESFEQDADDVAALMRKLNIEKADILGFSNGGNTAMQLYHRHPVVVGKLILASAFYKREGMLPGFFEGMKDATLDNMPRELKDEFIKVNPDTAKLRNMFNKDKERMMNFRDWDDAVLTSIKVPTLIICGDKDVVVAQHAVAMSKLIANSRLMLLPSEHGTYIGVAEVPMYDSELVQLTARVIDNFLSNMP